MADVDVSVTQGSGTSIRCFQSVSGDYDQYVRSAYANAKGTLSNIPWTVTTTGLSNVIPADVTRVGLVIMSNATNPVWVRFDSTIPTSTAMDYLLNAGDRWEVPQPLIQLAQSWAGQTAGGTMFAISGVKP